MKRIGLVILVLIISSIIFRGWLYRSLIRYQSIGQRSLYKATDKGLLNCIQHGINEKQSYEVKELIQQALDITSKQLQYSTNAISNDPNQLITTRKAHCVGYAAFTATVCNVLLEKAGLSKEWTAVPQIGQLYFLGINMHQYLHTPFFKDHDFVVVKSQKTGERISVDPTIADYLYIHFVRER